jgi:transketolase
MADKEMRAVYTEALMGLAEKDERIILLEADLMRANGTFPFRDRFPGRTFDCGVAEANMVSIAAGLSAMGKIPFAGTFCCFAARRAFDQFFVSANYARLNVKLVGTDPGVTATYNGGTHNSLEDVGLMRTIPRLVVFEPCDAVSLRRLLALSAYNNGCTYMRLHRKAVPPVYGAGEEFELGKGKVLLDGDDVTLVAAGAVMVPEALKAAELLKKDGVSAAVIDMHTFKPLDEELLVRYAEKTGAVVSCENHQVTGGLGSAVAETLSEKRPTLLRRVGIRGEFGEVGTLDYLQERFGLTAANIRRQAADLLDGGCAG